MGLKDKNVEDKSSQSRTLPSGLIIEDLQMGKSDGKTAAPGKKACCLYSYFCVFFSLIFYSSICIMYY